MPVTIAEYQYETNRLPTVQTPFGMSVNAPSTSTLRVSQNDEGVNLSIVNSTICLLSRGLIEGGRGTGG